MKTVNVWREKKQIVTYRYLEFPVTMSQDVINNQSVNRLQPKAFCAR